MVEKFVEYAIKSIARHPDKVSVKRETLDGRDTIVVRVDDEDRGRVVGRQGRTIKAVRTIVSVMSAGPGPIYVVVVE